MKYEVRNSAGIIHKTNDIDEARKQLERFGSYYIQYTKEALDEINKELKED